MRHCLIFFFLLIASNPLYAQRRCGTPVIVDSLMRNSEKFNKSRAKIENYLDLFQREVDEVPPSVVTIPVVVHVVYKNESERIPEQRIVQQIELLTKDFRVKNQDIAIVPEKFRSKIADTNIEFKLAVRDQNNQHSQGIVYQRTNSPSFSMITDFVKKKSTGGDDPWNPESYLNIWVCDLVNYSGYAIPPTLNRTISKEHDGVVINYQYFGVNDIQGYLSRGRTLTHEVGHWLDLKHIWGECTPTDPCCFSCDDDDGVPDTPVQGTCNQGPIDPNNPPQSCNNGGDLYVNYMDYVNDDTMVMFTERQAIRMWGTLQNARQKLLNTRGLLPFTRSNLFD